MKSICVKNIQFSVIFRQANVSAVYRRPVSESPATSSDATTANKPDAIPGPSHTTFDAIALVKHEKNDPITETKNEPGTSVEKCHSPEKVDDKWSKIEADTECSRQANFKVEESSSMSSLTEENFERRLNIEEEVTFVCILYINSHCPPPVWPLWGTVTK